MLEMVGIRKDFLEMTLEVSQDFRKRCVRKVYPKMLQQKVLNY